MCGERPGPAARTRAIRAPPDTRQASGRSRRARFPVLLLARRRAGAARASCLPRMSGKVPIFHRRGLGGYNNVVPRRGVRNPGSERSRKPPGLAALVGSNPTPSAML